MTELEQKQILSKNLKHYIELSGKEQKQIAFDLGYNVTTFNQWVVGKAIPAVTILHSVAKYFGVSLEDLVNEHDDSDTYYINPKTADMAQKLFEDSNYRILFDAAKDSKPEDLLMAADLLKRLKGTNPDG